MTLAKAEAKAKAKTKHIYSTGINYVRRLRLSRYFYSTGHRMKLGLSFQLQICLGACRELMLL
jgi:hypothetical protein